MNFGNDCLKGSGARFANSNARYGIVTGRLGRGDKDSLITVSERFKNIKQVDDKHVY